MRQPALHVTREGLRKTLSSLAQSSQCPFDEYHIDWLTESLLREGFKHAVTGRMLVTVKAGKKQHQLTESQLDDAWTTTFAKILDSCRKAANHRSIKIITRGSTDWRILGQIAAQAKQFSEELGFPSPQHGAHRYCEIALSLMGNKYQFGKFRSLADRILMYASCEREIQNDPNAEYTEELHQIYRRFLEEAGTVAPDYRKDPERYIEFMFAHRQADTHNANYEDWVQAQFEGLDFMGDAPTPSQLHGEKALERYSKFVIRCNKR